MRGNFDFSIVFCTASGTERLFTFNEDGFDDLSEIYTLFVKIPFFKNSLYNIGEWSLSMYF